MNPTRLKTGDILHCRRNKLLSKLIRKFTKSQYSHTAIFIEIWGNPYVIDAQKDGVNLRPWDAWREEYNYYLEIHRRPGPLSASAFSKRAMTKIGHTAYDFEGLLLRYPWKIFTGSWKKRSNEHARMFCSEYVAWVYGADKAYRMSPEDMYQWCKLNQFISIQP